MKSIKVLQRINTFALVSGLFFLLQNFTFGLLPIAKRIVLFDAIYLKDLIFIGTSVWITSKTIHFDKKRI